MFGKRSGSDEYAIRLDAMNLALDYRGMGVITRNNREFLQMANDFYGYLNDGTIPDLLGKATKTVLKGK